MEDQDNNAYGQGKRPLWQWGLIYAVVGIVVYGLIYYFVFAPSPTVTPAVSPVATSEATSPATQVSEGTVTLTADGFFPKTLSVKAGTKVTWTNLSGNSATVNSDPHPVHTAYQLLNLGSLPNGGAVSLTFDKPGTYGYHNHLNPSQSGEVIVK